MLRKFLPALLWGLSTSLYAQYNSISHNGPTNDFKGYGYEFLGKTGDNCLKWLGLSSYTSAVDWTVSLNEATGALTIKGSQNVANPKNKWVIDHIFADSACERLKKSIDLSTNLSISYRVRSNTALSAFSINARTLYWGGDYWDVQPLSLCPPVELGANTWKEFSFILCKGDAMWDEKIQGIRSGNRIERTDGFEIRLDETTPIPSTLQLDIDYVRIGEAASHCTTTGLDMHSDQETFPSVLPNPFQDHIQLHGSEALSSAEILDVHQQLVKRIDEGLDQKIQLSDLKSGVYFVRYVTKNNLSHTVKILKQ